MKVYDTQEPVFKSHHLVVALVDLAKQRGIHPDKLLKGSRIFYDDLLRSNIAISYQQTERIIANIIKIPSMIDASFLVGRRLFPGHLNEISPALLHCESVIALFRVLMCNQQLFFPYISLQVQRDQQSFYFIPRATMSIGHDEVSKFLLEVWLGIIVSILKWRVEHVPPFDCNFAYNLPKHVEQYQANLPGNIYFNQPLTIIKCALDCRLITCIESNMSLKRYYLGTLKSTPQKSLIQLLTQSILNGQVNTLEQASDQLSMSSATLKRKLKRFDCNFQSLLDNVRKQQAVFQISYLGYTNEKVAQCMSFNDIPNFRRAFKRWTGMTPNDLRQV